jgi:cysteine desulfurase
MSKVKPNDFIYLDNNATTRVCDDASRLMTDWIQSCSNISSSNKLGLAGRDLVDKARAEVDRLCSLKGAYHILFTSGASESNCTVLHMVVDAWHKNVGGRPHIVSSSIEHKSIIEGLHQLQDAKRADVTLVEPNMYGIIDPADVEAAIRKNTALVTIMFANNELGSINLVRKIGAIAHRHQVPFHTDAVQIFGKIAIDIPAFNIDALSMSFHKLYGPPGMGMLILRKTFVAGYKLQGQISGSQQAGLRGGTENLPGIAGATGALISNFRKRREKNARLEQLRALLIELLTVKNPWGYRLPLVPYDEFYDSGDADGTGGAGTREKKNDKTDKTEKKVERIPMWRQNSSGVDPEKRGKALCILGAQEKNSYLPNTLLMSVVDYDKDFCNVRFKKLLETQGVIVSIGSACNTANKNASHVLDAVCAPPIIKRGVLRVSMGDLNTQTDIRNFARIFLQAVQSL